MPFSVNVHVNTHTIVKCMTTLAFALFSLYLRALTIHFVFTIINLSYVVLLFFVCVCFFLVRAAYLFIFFLLHKVVSFSLTLLVSTSLSLHSKTVRRLLFFTLYLLFTACRWKSSQRFMLSVYYFFACVRFLLCRFSFATFFHIQMYPNNFLDAFRSLDRVM